MTTSIDLAAPRCCSIPLCRPCCSTSRGSDLLLVILARSYGLYGPILSRNGLNEQRMTVQAALTAGLLLCGTLYLRRAEAVSREVVMLMVVFCTMLLCLRRAIWRKVVYSRYREGLETRNVLIVGAGRVAHALRNHLESLRHLGFRFKGFVALTEREAESGDADIIGDVRNCLSLARSLFVDEIFFSVPAEKKLVIALVEEARGIGHRCPRGAGSLRRPGVECAGGIHRPVSDDSAAPARPAHWRVSDEAGAGYHRSATGAADRIAGYAGLMHCDQDWIPNGPVFYRAQRIGRKGRTFTCYKFRTMCINADKLKKDLEHKNERDGILFKIANDPRVTRVGRILRKYSLDELPQFYNVLAWRYEPGGSSAADGVRGGAVRHLRICAGWMCCRA